MCSMRFFLEDVVEDAGGSIDQGVTPSPSLAKRLAGLLDVLSATVNQIGRTRMELKRLFELRINEKGESPASEPDVPRSYA